jgi:glucokinase
VVDPGGAACGCGRLGCLETVAAGPAIVRWARQHGSSAETAKEVTEAARAGDATALAALERAGTAIGFALANVTNLLDLDVAAIGGGVAQAGELLFGPIGAELERQGGMHWTRALRVLPAELGQDAGLLGAAALVLEGDRYWA